jgi:N utilization substance protein B
MLYELLQTNHDIASVMERHIAQPIVNEQDDTVAPVTITESQQVFIRTLLQVSLNQRLNHDALIMELAPSVPIEAMPLLQRSVLYVAMSELRYMTTEQGRGDTGVIVNAAVEITRAYVGDTAARFVNGVLASVTLRFPDSRENASDL